MASRFRIQELSDDGSGPADEDEHGGHADLQASRETGFRLAARPELSSAQRQRPASKGRRQKASLEENEVPALGTEDDVQPRSAAHFRDLEVDVDNASDGNNNQTLRPLV